MKQGWTIKKLGEVCHFQNGFAFKSNLFTKAGEPIVRISDIQNEEVCVDNLVYFSLDSYKEDLSRFVVYPNDILIAMSGGTTGKLGINRTGRKFYLNQRVGVFREDKKVLDHSYLFYYLHTKSDESLRIAAGAAQPNLSTAQVNAFEIPIPPLFEQQRIVSLLDAEFAKIDALKANAEKNLQNAKDLFQAALKKELETKEGKNIVPLGVLCEFSQGLQVDVKNQSEVQESGMVRFLRIIDFTQGTESPRYINKPIDKFFLKKDEIAIVRYGASAGFVCYGYEGVIANNLFKVDVRNDFRLISKYLYYVLKSDIFQSVVRKGVGGVAMPAISFGTIKGIEIPYPSSVQEQIIIVARLDALNEKCKTLQANYEKTLSLCDDLKQALLRKTFNGEI